MGQQWHRFSARNLTMIVILGLILLFRPPSRIDVSHTPSPQSFADMITMVETIGQEPIQPLPTAIQWPTEQVELGRRLFNEPQLSSNHQMACATCHILQSGGDDGLPVSVGQDNQALAFNAPTVLNSGFNFRQFWDGRVSSLEEQVDGPLLDPLEMGSSWENVLSFLRSNRDYRQAFQKAYDGNISQITVRQAIATFERSLITPSPFDVYLRGDQEAISTDAQLGYQRFKDYGCIACHQGVNVGGNVFQPFRAMQQYRSSISSISSSLPESDGSGLTISTVTNKNPSLENVQGDPGLTQFKVPSLRNVALTGPYLHDGSVTKLQDVIQIMASAQLGRSIAPEHVRQIEAFLESLTGEQIGGDDV